MVQSWLNADSLYLKFGTDAPGPTTVGETKTYGPWRQVDIKLDPTTLTSTSSIISDQYFFPTNARIQEILVVSETACTSGGSPTLDLGLIGTDRSTLQTNGGTAFLSAVALSTINGNGKEQTISVGSTGAGNFVGVTNTIVSYLTARANTATFTGGLLKISIRYYRV